MQRESGDISESDSSFDDDDDDQDWGDWVEEDLDNGGMTFAGSSSKPLASSKTISYHALFQDDSAVKSTLRSFDTPMEAIHHASSLGCDLLEVISRCRLDTLQVIRLINRLRRQTVQATSTDTYLSPTHVSMLSGTEAFLEDDKELLPVPGYENDGLLQVGFDELIAESGNGRSVHTEEARKISELESQLHATRLAMEDLRGRLMESVGIGSALRKEEDAHASVTRHLDETTTNEDSHYFSSYASHDIHQIMISDQVRTLSYAKFLLSPHNSHLLRGKVVMDVGCGSGILSLFAARAGAKEVIAIDASDVAGRAQENVRANRFDGIITIYKGKVEELGKALRAYEGQVDVIVSEWMGYFLLYESMLPSVLYARDRYLRKGGLLAPSHTRMLLAAVADCSLISERLKFWDNVHGFSLQAMKVGLADEAWTDTLQPEHVASSIETLFDLPHQTMKAAQPTFTAPFMLQLERGCTVQAFVSWFDTWFTPDGLPVPSGGRSDLQGGEKLEKLPAVTTRCPKAGEVRGLDLQKDATVAKATDIEDDKGEIVSFTTGPQGLETHWKQTLFVLKEPIKVEKGTTLVGELRCKPNAENVREVDVEIHFAVRQARGRDQPQGKKAVETRTVQLFAVR